MNDIFEKYVNNNKNINRGFRGLIVWQEAIKLFVFTKNKIKNIKTISFKTYSQIESSSFSIHSSIAEGYCRRHLKEYIQFINIALASLGENYSQLFALTISGDIEEEWFAEYDKMHYSLENKLIKLNKENIQKLENKGDWNDDYLIHEILENYNINNY